MIAALAAAFALATAAPSVRMTVLGDSLALGTGASDSSRGFAFVLFRRLAAQAPGSEVTNLAIGGATVADLVRLELPRLAAGRPSLILVAIGGNDAVRGRSLAEFAGDYHRLAVHLRESAPQARIVLFNVPDVSVSPIFDRSSKPELHERAAAFNRVVEREARAIGAQVVDTFASSELLRKEPGRYLSRDQFHPSDAGYAAIAERAWPVVSKAR
jgi:lysophospholipase L1-like esterase